MKPQFFCETSGFNGGITEDSRLLCCYRATDVSNDRTVVIFGIKSHRRLSLLVRSVTNQKARIKT